jgi:mono/diheme cytochrome c family protein
MVCTFRTDNLRARPISTANRSVIMKPDVRSKCRSLQPGIVFSLLVCAGIAVSGGARAAGQDGWYTQDQATRGHQLFNNYCAQCHRPDLTGAAGPALVGETFLTQWNNKPLSDLFSFEHSKMPATNPGSVPDDTMWNITAYILQKNGLPAGSVALSQPTAANRVLTATK